MENFLNPRHLCFFLNHGNKPLHSLEVFLSGNCPVQMGVKGVTAASKLLASNSQLPKAALPPLCMTMARCSTWVLLHR